MAESEITIKKQLDAICDLFEENWSKDERPQFDSYLNRVDESHRDQLLLMLVEIDVDLRRKNDLPVSSSDYEALGNGAITHVDELLSTDMDATMPPGDLNRNSDQPLTALPAGSNATSPGRMIGPYKLLQQIGEGGMGSVWMAEQEKPVRRRVALKLIRADLGSKEVVARFEAERQALAMMDHQNIARVLDAGTTDDGSPYFVMELVKGIPITQFCDDNKLSIKERLELFVPVCKAIQHAHQKGIIHRDLKPSNVLVTLYDGEPVPKVIDFGLAKALEHTTKLTDKTMFTEFGKVVGTVQYMSPEQAEMNALDVDTRTDVYSLGVMLYELLTGSTPLDKETIGKNAILQILAIIKEKEPPRPSHRLSSSAEKLTGISEQRKINPDRLQKILRGELDWVVMKALEKDRRRRYETASDFAQDIQRYLDDETVEARPPSTGYRFKKFISKNKAYVATVATIMLLLLAGIAGTSFGLIQANQKAMEAERQTKIADDKTKDALEAKSLATDRAIAVTVANEKTEATLARSNFLLAVSRWEENPPRVEEALDYLGRIPEKHRQVEWLLAKKQFEGSYATLYGHNFAISCVDFYPDGKHIVSGGLDTIKTWESDTGKLLHSFPGSLEHVFCLSVSPDGKQIVSGQINVIKLWDAKSGRYIKSLVGHHSHVECICFSKNGNQVISGSLDNTIKIWDIKTGKEIRTLTGHTEGVSSVTITADQSKIISVSSDRTIRIWDAETGVELKKIEASTNAVSVCLNPDGRTFVTANDDQTIRTWDIVTGEPLNVFDGHVAGNLCFSPDGEYIAGTTNATLKIWNAETGEEIKTLKGHFDAVTSVSFSPDGQRLVSGSRDNTIKLWSDFDMDELGATKVLRGHSSPIETISSSPDGTRIASGSKKGKIKIWDANSGKQLESLEGHTGSINSVCFNWDGSKLTSSAADKSIKIWNVETGKVLNTFRGLEAAVSNVVFSPDGKYVVSAGGYDQTLRIWEIKSGIALKVLRGHRGYVSDVAMSSNGKSVLSASYDKTVQIWDFETGETINRLTPDVTGVKSAIFSPDEKPNSLTQWVLN